MRRGRRQRRVGSGGEPRARRLVEQVNVGRIDGERHLVARLQRRPAVRLDDDLGIANAHDELRFGAGRLDDDDLAGHAAMRVTRELEMIGPHAVGDGLAVGARTRTERPAHAVGRFDVRHPVGPAQRALHDVHCRRADELSDEQIVRTVVQLERRADLLDDAVVHDDNAVGHRHRLDLVVGDIDGRRLQPLVQRLDLRAHLHAKLRIEVRQRLVEQEHLRIANDRPAHRDALPLAAGKLAREHNLHNLGAALIDEAAARGLPSYFSTHNYWPICPRAYLLTGEGAICAGPGERGANCASCVGSPHDRPGHQERLAGIRDRFTRGVSVCLAVSDAMRATLAGQDYPREMIDVVRQAVPAADETLEQLGRDRRPGRTGERLTVAFFGSAYPHKGPQLLVEAAQRSEQDLRVLVHGEVDERFAARLRAADQRGVVELCGAFSPAALPELLAGVDVAVMPSMWWDCAPLMAAECLAGRVPLVVPRLGGLGEAIVDEVDGLFFDALDAGDLARQLDRLAAEPGLLERLQAGIEAPRPFAAYVDELEAYYAGERPSRSAFDTAAPAVTWQGDHGLHTSLSHINNEVTARLDGVQRLDRTGAPIDGPLPHAADVEVRHQWPPDLRPPRSGRLAVIQPWEFGAIPADWLEPLQRDVDELWVPSQFVRRMYLDAGLEEDRVHVVPNGVDLERFAPDGEAYPLDGTPAVRFLFVGGAIARKGVDILLAAWQDAFAGRDDVQLVIKDFGSDGVYRGADRSAIHAAAQAGSIVHLDADLADAEMAALYRACDVLVHPYRGEGFAMPVLEAMASGLPVIHTAGGPTDEFCPPQAGWRLRAQRRAMPGGRVDHFETVGEPWMLEPDSVHLAELLRAAADADDRATRGAIGRSAALHFGWERIAGLYAERARDLAARVPRLAASDRVLDGAPSVLASPAWRAADELPALLRAWRQAPAGACLYLLADPATDGTPAELEARVMAAAAGIDLDACADITILREHAVPGRDAALHAAADLYVPLHAACAGHVRLPGAAVVTLADLAIRLAAAPSARAA